MRHQQVRDHERYNQAVEQLQPLVVPGLEFSLGGPLPSPIPDEVVARFADAPRPGKRLLYRVDRFERESGCAYRCFTSNNDDDWCYFNALVIEAVGDEPKLVAVAFRARIDDERFEWRLRSGDRGRFKREGSHEIRWDALGECVETTRFARPREDVSQLYHDDHISF